MPGRYEQAFEKLCDKFRYSAPLAAKEGIIPYQSPSITVPDMTLPKRRSERERGVATSPIKFIGNRSGMGLNNAVT